MSLLRDQIRDDYGHLSFKQRSYVQLEFPKRANLARVNTPNGETPDIQP